MNNHRNKAFTYIELLVVIAVLAIVGSMAVLAFGDFGRGRSVKAQGREFQSLLNLAQYHAILEPCLMGIKLVPTGYQFLRFDSNSKKWRPLTRRIWRQRMWLPQSTYQLNVTETPTQEPQILAYPTGEITPFQLDLYYQGRLSTVIKGSANGEVQHEDP